MDAVQPVAGRLRERDRVALALDVAARALKDAGYDDRAVPRDSFPPGVCRRRNYDPWPFRSGSPRQRRKKRSMSRKLFVGGLSWNTTDEGLREAFEKFGSVVEAKVVTDRETGRPRGFAFVELTEAKMAESAIAELHGTQFGGRKIVVNQAHTPRNESRGGGAGGPGRPPR